MSRPHRATPEQWANHERWTSDHDSSCLLELRARIEALEAGAKQRINELEPPELSDREVLALSERPPENETLTNRIRRIYRAGWDAAMAGATCPHIVTSDEGTSYCALAEQTARIGHPDVPADTSTSKPTSNSSQIRSSLVEAVHIAISTAMGHGPSEACAAISAVAEWLDIKGQHGCSLWLREEVKR